MGRGGYYDFGDAAGDVGNKLGDFFGNWDKQNRADEEKKKKLGDDQDYLNWLTGQMPQTQAPIDIPAPPQLQAGEHTGSEPIAGPQLPSGMMEPDPSVAPTSPDQGLPGGAPYSNQYLEDPNSLIEAQKAKAQQAKAQQANESLFSDPAQTMNMLIEAKKRQVSPDMGSLLEFIAKQHETSVQHKFKSDETEKAAKVKFDTEDRRTKAMTFRDESKRRLQEKLADAANQTRLKIAGMHGKKGPLDEGDIQAMSESELDALDQELADEAAGFTKPDQAHYDSYDGLSMAEYRKDLEDYFKIKQGVDKVQRLIGRAQAIRQAKPGTGVHKTAPGRSPAPAPQKKGVYNPTTGQIEYR